MIGDVLSNRMYHLKVFNNAYEFDKAIMKIKNIHEDMRK